MQNIPRKDRTLNDAVEILNEPLIKANNDVNGAWQILRQYPDQLEFVSNELDRCLDLRYFLENWYCIKTENGIIKTLYPFWDHQEIIYEAAQEEWNEKGQCLMIILKPRQAGVTVWVSASMFHRVNFTPNVFLLTVAQNDRTAAHIFKMMNNAYQLLPWWMRPEQLFKQEGQYMEFQRQDDARRLTDPGLGSVIQIDHAQKMTGVAIGRTIRCFHASEVSRWPDADVFTADIEPSMNAKDEYGVMESTAFGRNGLYYDHWRGSVDGDTGWRAVFIPVYKVRKYSLPAPEDFVLTKEEKAFTERVNKEENFEISNNFWTWRRRRLKATIRSTGSPWGHMESYPITPDEAFQSSGVCAFDRMSLQNQRLSSVCKPLWCGEIMLVNVEAGVINTDMIREVADDEILPKRKSDNNQLKRDRLWVWEFPEDNAVYYVASDTALGVPDGDYSVAEVWRLGVGAEADTQVAEWWGHCPPSEFAKINAALGFWYRGQNSASEIATEYQGPGITCGDKLKDMDYPNLYRPMNKDRVQNPYTNWFHWMTNQKTRDSIIATMNEALLAHTVCIRSEDLVDEMADFGSLGGRFEGQGNHDDGCFPAGVKLLTKRGRIPIEDVTVGDYVLGHDSQWHTVNITIKRPVEEKIYTIKVWGVREPIICTGAHPIWCKTRRFSSPVTLDQADWVTARCIDKGDFVFVPREPLEENIFTDDEMYLLGWYLGDGYSSHLGQIRITFGAREIACAKKIQRIIQEIVDKHPTLGEPNKTGHHKTPHKSKASLRVRKNWVAVECGNKWLSIWLREWCGGPKNKKINSRLLRCRNSLALAVGFLEAEGCQSAPRRDISAAQKGDQILDDIQRILINSGIWSTRGEHQRAGVKFLNIGAPWVNVLLTLFPGNRFTSVERKLKHPMARPESGGFWLPIKSVREDGFKGHVYNMSVDGSNSYTAGNIAVHNCMAAMIGLYCMRETTLHIKQAGIADESMHRQTADLNVYAVYDNLMRQRGQYTSEAQAKEVASEKTGWSVRPLMLCKANTAWSPIFHGNGAHRDLHRKFGMKSVDILPDVTNAYQAVLDSGRGDMEDDDGW